MLVIDVERGGDALGDHARAKASRGALGDPAVEDQLHLSRIAEVEILMNHLLEEGPASQRPVHYLRQSEFSLQDRNVVKPTLLTVCWSERVGQQAQPFTQQLI